MDKNSTNKTSPFLHFNEELDEIAPIFIVFQYFIGFVTIVMTLFVLTLFACSKQQSEGSFRRYFITLTIADLQCGVICTISFHFVVQGMKINHPYCMVAVSAVYYTLYVTFFLLVAMTVDRYFAIIHAILYKKYSTPKIFYFAVAVCWSIAAVMGFCVYYTCNKSAKYPETLCLVTVERTNDTLTVALIFLVNIPCTVAIFYAYVRILQVILKQISSKKAILEGNLSEINPRDLRACIILFLSVVLFLLIWLPWCVGYALFKYYPENVSLTLLLSIYLMFQINSMIHPFLYIRSIGDVDDILSRWFQFCQKNFSNLMKPRLK